VIIPCACFAHRQRSALEHLIIKAAYGFLTVGPVAELHEGEATRLAGFAVRWQGKGREGANGGEVRPQLRLSHVIREIANKKTYSHSVLLLGGWVVTRRLRSAASMRM
jgi:hypothetical protein